MQTQLLCTFTYENRLSETLEDIQEAYEIAFDKIFVLKNTENKKELFCTYNIDTTFDDFDGIPKTISIHRKKETNTLYTINALNKLIMKLNDGELDKTYQIPWTKYADSLLVTNNEDFKRIKTELYDIIHL